MAEWLPAAGIGYRWERRLGGFRKLPPGSPDTALRNESFRAYAGYMRSPEFTAAVAGLLAEAQDRQTAIMCSETVWWRCHRRLIADHCLLLAGTPVEHLMPPAKRTPHVPTKGVRIMATSCGMTSWTDSSQAHPGPLTLRGNAPTVNSDSRVSWNPGACHANVRRRAEAAQGVGAGTDRGRSPSGHGAALRLPCPPHSGGAHRRITCLPARARDRRGGHRQPGGGRRRGGFPAAGAGRVPSAEPALPRQERTAAAHRLT